MAEFPIKTLAVLIIIVITLIALIAFFIFGMRQKESLELQQSINAACQRFVNIGCNNEAWDDVHDDTLVGADTNLDIDGSGTVEIGEYFSQFTFQIRCGCTPWGSWGGEEGGIPGGEETGGEGEECPGGCPPGSSCINGQCFM